MKPFLRCLIGKTAVLIATLLAWQIDAAPPVNDTCAGALVISNAFPYLTAIVDVAQATTNGDPVLPPIGDCRAGSVSRSVWYAFTPLVTTNYTVSTCTDTATTLADTVMAIYLASGPCGNLSLFECADDTCDLPAAIETVLEAGTTYYIVVWNSGNVISSSNTLVQLRVSPPIIAANDLCAGAEPIPSAGPFPHLTAFADTRLAGRVGDPANPACGAAFDRSVWYRFTPAASGAYNFSLCTDTGTTIFDTVLAIYSATSCAGPFTRVACNDDACEFKSALTTNLTAGTTYYILAWDPDYTTGESLIQLRVAGTVPGIISGRRLLNGRYELRFNANFGQRYTVQAANDLLGTWNSIGTITNGTAVFLDTNAVTFSRRFYRLRTP